jgi:hypothetical protein
MTSSTPRVFNDLADAVQAAVDELNSAVGAGDADAEAINVAHSNLLGALSDAAIASTEALGRFSPFTEPGFFGDEPRDITEVLSAGLDLPGDMVIL